MRAKDLVLVSLLSATITAAKFALAFIPNVEIVTLLFIVFTLTFGFKRTVLVAIVFSTTEIFIWGVHTWLLGYYIIWPLLILLAHILGKATESEYAFSALSMAFGLLFGFMFALLESLFYGPAYGFAYWIRGIPFDLIHGASNFVVALMLLKPVLALLRRLKEKYLNTSSFVEGH